jgi:hypothetical protein
MVAININPDQNSEIPAWRTKGKYTFPVLVTETSDYARVNYGVPGTPTNLILNSEGKMVFRHLGYGPGNEKTMEVEIRELLGLKPLEGIEPDKPAEKKK